MKAAAPRAAANEEVPMAALMVEVLLGGWLVARSGGVVAVEVE